MRRNFHGKNVVITGAGGGLGRALAHRFGRAGATIGGVDVDGEALAATAEELRAAGVTVVTRTADLTDEEAAFLAVETLQDEIGATDVLINNAGITHLKSFAHGEEAAVCRVMDTNFMGSVHATGVALQGLVENRGLIVVISSVAGYAPLVARAGYCASKHALHGFFNTLRAELKTAGVDVLIVCPSYIATGIRQSYRDDEAVEGRRQVVGREDTPEAVAEKIFHAAERGRRFLTTGRVGAMSFWVHRFAPRLYEYLMIRRVRGE